ncbi:MAG: TlpA family protein disulfide reductase [Gammaproteobacteria bacterium]|nr:TlpA family protein disulfide reductase [Gammaproteobacteria bacterium]
MKIETGKLRYLMAVKRLRATPLFGGVVSVLLFALLSVPTMALDQTDAVNLPHVNDDARDNFNNYIYSPKNRAFAIGPGGYWAWSNGVATPEAAAKQAVADCEKASAGYPCIVYALNDEIVFDEPAWNTLWRPYSTRKGAQAAKEGTGRGMRFYDLRFRTEKGAVRKLSDYRGKVKIVHFWGSWCPPCMRELPDLQAFYQSMDKSMRQNVELVMLQVREPLSQSAKWLNHNELKGLPLFDSGMKSALDTEFQLANGQKLPDRDIAFVFPTTYILDKNGVVLFRRFGPIRDWSEYRGLIADAAGLK